MRTGSRKVQLIQVEHARELVLKLTFADGTELLADFKAYFRDHATAGERRFALPKSFRAFKIIGTRALEWGDAELVFAAERLRNWRSPGVLPARSRIAA